MEHPYYKTHKVSMQINKDSNIEALKKDLIAHLIYTLWRAKKINFKEEPGKLCTTITWTD